MGFPCLLSIAFPRNDEQSANQSTPFCRRPLLDMRLTNGGTAMIELLAGIILSWPGIGCTYEHPQPVGINEICTGLGYPGTSCKVVYGSNCSPIPGMPGTWNPSGYTPKIG